MLSKWTHALLNQYWFHSSETNNSILLYYITLKILAVGVSLSNSWQSKFIQGFFNWWELMQWKQYISHFRVYINWWSFNSVAFVLIDSRACWPVNWHLKSCLNWYGSAGYVLALSWLMSLFTVSGVIVGVTSLQSASHPPVGPGSSGCIANSE